MGRKRPSIVLREAMDDGELHNKTKAFFFVTTFSFFK